MYMSIEMWFFTRLTEMCLITPLGVKRAKPKKNNPMETTLKKRKLEKLFFTPVETFCLHTNLKNTVMVC